MVPRGHGESPGISLVGFHSLVLSRSATAKMVNGDREQSLDSPGAPSELEKAEVDPEKCTDDTDVEGTQRTAGTIPHAKDWYPDVNSDPGNPQNWPLRKKLFQTAVPTSIAFLWCVDYFLPPNDTGGY